MIDAGSRALAGPRCRPQLLPCSPAGGEQLRRCSTVHDNLVVVDLRPEETIFSGNRFVVYALFPACDVSMHVLRGLRKQNTVFAIGKSIFNRANPVDIGALTLCYGGGGHAAAGACQIANEEAEYVLEELVTRLAAPPEGRTAA